MFIGYACVSIGGQNLDLQRDTLLAAGCEHHFFGHPEQQAETIIEPHTVVDELGQDAVAFVEIDTHTSTTLR